MKAYVCWTMSNFEAVWRMYKANSLEEAEQLVLDRTIKRGECEIEKLMNINKELEDRSTKDILIDECGLEVKEFVYDENIWKKVKAKVKYYADIATGKQTSELPNLQDWVKYWHYEHITPKVLYIANRMLMNMNNYIVEDTEDGLKPLTSHLDNKALGDVLSMYMNIFCLNSEHPIEANIILEMCLSPEITKV